MMVESSWSRMFISSFLRKHPDTLTARMAESREDIIHPAEQNVKQFTSLFDYFRRRVFTNENPLKEEKKRKKERKELDDEKMIDGEGRVERERARGFIAITQPAASSKKNVKKSHKDNDDTASLLRSDETSSEDDEEDFDADGTPNANGVNGVGEKFELLSPVNALFLDHVSVHPTHRLTIHGKPSSSNVGSSRSFTYNAENATTLRVKDELLFVDDFLRSIDSRYSTDLLHRSYQLWNLYLRPCDYHRFHSPVDGEIQSIQFIKAGRKYLFNEHFLAKLNALYEAIYLNTKVVVKIKSQKENRTLLMMLVGGKYINSVYIHPKFALKQQCTISAGEELGYFAFGSSVILLCSDAPNAHHVHRRATASNLNSNAVPSLHPLSLSPALSSSPASAPSPLLCSHSPPNSPPLSSSSSASSKSKSSMSSASIDELEHRRRYQFCEEVQVGTVLLKARHKLPA